LENLTSNKNDWDKIKYSKKIAKKKDFEYIDEYSPVFYTLNKSLQEEMVKILHELEITPDVNNFARYLGLNRERREFLAWLYKIMKLINE
jgi:hypothetical protein